MPADARSRIGQLVDKYSIVRLLGQGGMGAVYEARHVTLARRFAIKFLLPQSAANADILRRFENEAKAAGRLEHPNVAAVMDVGRAADGAPYLVMEFLEGADCGKLLNQTGPLPVKRAAGLVVQACRGLAAAHKAGIVHRDIKPENLFVTQSADGQDLVKVLDFGIAKLHQADTSVATSTGATFGTAYYMSPEQARGAGDVDARADVWSLGVVLYELLSGRRPFEGEQFLHIIHLILSVEPTSLAGLRPDLPPKLVAIVARAMAKSLVDRFVSTSAFAEALTPFTTGDLGAPVRSGEASRPTAPTPATLAEGNPSPGSAAGPGTAPGRRPGRAVIFGIAVGTLVIIGGVFGVGVLRRPPDARTGTPPSAGPATAGTVPLREPPPPPPATPPAPDPVPWAAVPPNSGMPAAPISAHPPVTTTVVRTASEPSEHHPGRRHPGAPVNRQPPMAAPVSVDTPLKPAPPGTSPAPGRPIDIEKDNPYGP